MNTDTLVKCIKLCSKRKSGETYFAKVDYSQTSHLPTRLFWWISLGAIPQSNNANDLVAQIIVLKDEQENLIYVCRDVNGAYTTNELDPKHTLMMLQAT